MTDECTTLHQEIAPKPPVLPSAYRHTAIQTRHGYVDIFDPDPDSIDGRDIAHGLAFTCRFSGFTSHYYSVAQHSYNVSNLLRHTNCSLEIQMQGLLHDAAEAYMGDMPTPHKRRFKEFAEVEGHLGAVIFDRFGLPWPMHEMVHWADDILLHIEARFLLPEPTWARFEPMPTCVDLTPWPVEMAKRLFLVRLRALMQAVKSEACE